MLKISSLLVSQQTKAYLIMQICTDEYIINLLQATYQSSNTQQIFEAQQALLNYMLSNTPHSFSQIQKLLVGSSIDHFCKKAAANLVKISAREILKILWDLNKQEGQAQAYIKVLFTTEHMFDNLKISTEFKPQIAEAYVSLFNFFNPENNNRLISKSRYFFNIKQETQAIALIQAYHRGQAPFKFRGAFYLAALQTLIQNLYKNVANLTQQTSFQPISQTNAHIISKYLQIIRQIWLDQGFQKFQSVFTNLLAKPVFNQLISIFSNNKWPRALTSKIYDILDCTVHSLGRCNLFPQYQKFYQLLSQIGKKLLAQYLSKYSQLSYDEDISQLNFLIAVIQHKIVSCHLDCLSLFSQLIYPNFKCIQKHLSHLLGDQPQMFDFLQDCAFEMQSDCIPIKRNKLLITMCRHSAECASSLRSIIYSFLFSHLPKISMGDVSSVCVNYSLESGEEMWRLVNQKLDLVQQSSCVLLLTSLQVGIFMSDGSFLSYLQKFVESNFYFLLQKNTQIVFHAILLYRNYSDDIFSTVGCVSFKIRLMKHIFNPSQSLIKHFAIHVLKEQVSKQIPLSALQYQVDQIIKFMSVNFTDSLLPLIVLIFKEYGSQLKQPEVIAIITKCFQSWTSKTTNLQSLSLQLLSNFFEIKSCANYYQDFLVSLLTIANQQMPLIRKYCDEFLELLQKGLKAIGRLPQNFEMTVMQLNLQITNNQIMQSLNTLLSYSRKQLFFSWVCDLIIRSELTIRSVLILHSLIYYGHSFLSVRNIRDIISATYIYRLFANNQFNYINGKLNLVFVLLFRYRTDDTNRLLLQQDWTHVHEQVNRKRQLQNILTKKTQQSRVNTIDQVYQLVYRAQNVYRWKYDIQLFLINQIWMLRHKLTDDMQMRYANLSFVACATNIVRAFEISQEANEGSDCESDDSLHRRTELQRNCYAARKVLQGYTIPAQFANANYFKQFKSLLALLKEDGDSRKWLQIILSKLMQNFRMHSLNQIMQNQEVQGSFRKIVRVSRP